jgi:hypothetical protein
MHRCMADLDLQRMWLMWDHVCSPALNQLTTIYCWVSDGRGYGQYLHIFGYQCRVALCDKLGTVLHALYQNLQVWSV